MKWLCKIIGHRMFSDDGCIGGASTCSRCNHKEPALPLGRIPKMPPVKKPKKY